MKTIFEAAAAPVVPVHGSDAGFPVHRIYCVGRNYADHAKEMGFPEREAPFFFMKPADAVLPVRPGEVGVLPYPGQTANFHHEVELVVAIGPAAGDGACNVDVAEAQRLIFGYAAGLDMTRRDLQFALRDKGRPWDVSKGFDKSAPIGVIHRATETGHFSETAIRLSVNGTVRQDSDIAQLIWNVQETISELSTYFALRPGDLIYTGTPAGVGAVVAGDLIEGSIAGLSPVVVRVV
jgi:fumarylpyruvate hydrolase